MEEEALTSGRKREAETSPEQREAELRQALTCEVAVLGEVEEQNWIRIENGTDWIPDDKARTGDHLEFEGLFIDNPWV